MQGVCPICKGSNLDYGERLDGTSSIGFDWKCGDCESIGVEWYNLEFAEHGVLYNGKDKV